MQTRSKKVVIDEVLFGSSEENEDFKMKRKEEEAEVIRLEEDEESNEYLNDVYVVELGVKEQEREDVQDVIQKELENMNKYGVFGERMPAGNKEIVGTRLVVTEGEKHDWQKAKIKARLICQGFKEIDKAQSDSPTAH